MSSCDAAGVVGYINVLTLGDMHVLYKTLGHYIFDSYASWRPR